MKLLSWIFLIVLLNSCSLNKNSKFWTENNPKKIANKTKLENVFNKSNDIMTMTFEEYEIYINEYVKRNNFPDINK